MTLLTLAAVFAGLSLLAVGGANAVVAEIQRQSVQVHHWITAAQFPALFALGQAAPGPNLLVVTLIGQRAAGPAGALVASLAFCVPTAALAFLLAQGWERLRDRPWRPTLQAALGALATGLIAASAVTLLGAACPTVPLAAIAAVTAAASLAFRASPLLWLAGAALAGLALPG